MTVNDALTVLLGSAGVMAVAALFVLVFGFLLFDKDSERKFLMRVIYIIIAAAVVMVVFAGVVVLLHTH